MPALGRRVTLCTRNFPYPTAQAVHNLLLLAALREDA